MNEEVVCDYEYMDDYMKLESFVDVIYNVGKMGNNKNGKTFQQTIKESIGTVRKFKEDYKDQFKFVQSLLELYSTYK